MLRSSVDMNGRGPDVMVYSDPALNPGGSDFAGHFQDANRPNESVVAFSANRLTVSILAQSGLAGSLPPVSGPPPKPGPTPTAGVPEPSAALLLGMGFVVVSAGLRRRR